MTPIQIRDLIKKGIISAAEGAKIARKIREGAR